MSEKPKEVFLQHVESATAGQIKKFEMIKRMKKERLLNAYLSKGNYMVIDHVSTGGFYHRTIYGRRGGWNSTTCYRCYDMEDKEPYGVVYKEQT